MGIYTGKTQANRCTICDLFLNRCTKTWNLFVKFWFAIDGITIRNRDLASCRQEPISNRLPLPRMENMVMLIVVWQFVPEHSMHEEFVIPSLFFLRLSRHWKSGHLRLTYYGWGGCWGLWKTDKPLKKLPETEKPLVFFAKNRKPDAKKLKTRKRQRTPKPKIPTAPSYGIYTVLRHKSCKYWNFKGLSEPGYLWQVAALSSNSET